MAQSYTLFYASLFVSHIDDLFIIFSFIHRSFIFSLLPSMIYSSLLSLLSFQLSLISLSSLSFILGVLVMTLPLLFSSSTLFQSLLVFITFLLFLSLLLFYDPVIAIPCISDLLSLPISLSLFRVFLCLVLFLDSRLRGNDGRDAGMAKKKYENGKERHGNDKAKIRRGFENDRRIRNNKETSYNRRTKNDRGTRNNSRDKNNRKVMNTKRDWSDKVDRRK